MQWSSNIFFFFICDNFMSCNFVWGNFLSCNLMYFYLLPRDFSQLRPLYLWYAFFIFYNCILWNDNMTHFAYTYLGWYGIICPLRLITSYQPVLLGWYRHISLFYWADNATSACSTGLIMWYQPVRLGW